VPSGSRSFLAPGAAWLVLIGLTLTACIVATDHAEPTPETVLPRLLAVLKDPDPEMRRTAAQSLGKIASAKGGSALVAALRDPDAGVRRNAAWALGKIGSEEFDWSPVILLLFDSDPTVREAAGLALGRTGATLATVKVLEERIQDPGVASDTKRLAAAALGGTEARTAVPILTKLLHDRDAQVRRWAVAALGEIADPQTVGPLGELLRKDPDPGVRVEAAFRLGKFGGKAAEPALISARKDADENVRRLIEAALKESGSGGKS
jgi:HEAT repeat protein